MMRISKKNKIAMFRIAMDLFERGYSFGFCDALTKAYYGVKNKHCNTPLRDLFPEIWKYKPANCQTVYWFDCNATGIGKRIKILRDEIEVLNNSDSMITFIRRISGLKRIWTNKARKNG